MHHAFQIGEHEYNVELARAGDGAGYHLHFGDRRYAVQLDGPRLGRGRLLIDGVFVDVVIATHGDDIYLHLDGESHQLRYRHPLQRLAAQSHGGAEDSIRAPMPGNIVAVAVSAGAAVTRGQTLLVMESMKMETTIVAPRDGVVAAVHFDKGQTFDRDALLLTLEALA